MKDERTQDFNFETLVYKVWLKVVDTCIFEDGNDFNQIATNILVYKKS
jgi:hypothetical protein